MVIRRSLMCAVGIGICVVWSVNGFLPRYQPKVKLLRSFKAEEKSGVEISTKDGMATVWSGDEDVTVPVSQVTQEENEHQFGVINYVDNMQCWIHGECPVEKDAEKSFLKPWKKDYIASQTLHTVFSGDDISEEPMPAHSERGDWAEL